MTNPYVSWAGKKTHRLVNDAHTWCGYIIAETAAQNQFAPTFDEASKDFCGHCINALRRGKASKPCPTKKKMQPIATSSTNAAQAIQPPRTHTHTIVQSAVPRQRPFVNLLQKYAPQTIDDIHGQSWIVHQLKLFLESPYPCAFMFHGASGCGKSSTALALAKSLGIIEEADLNGGLFQIASGEQTGEKVRDVVDRLRYCPLVGSRWRMLIINEADAMTPNAAYTWLDVLENIPPHTVIAFTTNNLHKIPGRLRDRCECFGFESKLLTVRQDLQDFAKMVWQKEECPGECPEVEEFGQLQDDSGDCSWRRLLQVMTPFVRSGTRPMVEMAVA